MLEAGDKRSQEKALDEADFRRVVERLTHRLRNSLTLINASLQLASPQLKPGSPLAGTFEMLSDEGRRLLASARAAQRLTEMTCALTLRFDVGVLARDTALSVARQFEGEARLTCEGPEGVFAKTDPTLIQQALSELVANAFYFGGAGRPVNVCWELSGGEIRLTVTDRGAGLPPALARRLPEPFFSTADRAGMGLTVASRACRLAGGRLIIESTPGSGSRFSIALPVGAA